MGKHCYGVIVLENGGIICCVNAKKGFLLFLHTQSERTFSWKKMHMNFEPSFNKWMVWSAKNRFWSNPSALVTDFTTKFFPNFWFFAFFHSQKSCKMTQVTLKCLNFDFVWDSFKEKCKNLFLRGPINEFCTIIVQYKIHYSVPSKTGILHFSLELILPQSK